jgi:hypothetical protein
MPAYCSCSSLLCLACSAAVGGRLRRRTKPLNLSRTIQLMRKVPKGRPSSSQPREPCWTARGSRAIWELQPNAIRPSRRGHHSDGPWTDRYRKATRQPQETTIPPTNQTIPFSESTTLELTYARPRVAWPANPLTQVPMASYKAYSRFPTRRRLCATEAQLHPCPTTATRI